MLLRTAGMSDMTIGWYDRLTKAYAEPQRHYHNLQHISECLVEFDQVRSLAKQPIAVEFALWFHDAVYNPKAGDNEEQSAALARQCIDECEIPGTLSDKVVRLIMATKHHNLGADLDMELMVDIDLSILGRDEKRFNEYEKQIRQEYAWVPVEVFAFKRAEILQGFLGREHIFNTDWFHCKYEEQARRNLAASIQKLKKIQAKSN